MERGLQFLARRLHNRPAGALDFEEYDRLVRLGIVAPAEYFGWAYMHSDLYDRRSAMRDIQVECKKAFEDGKDEPHARSRASRAFWRNLWPPVVRSRG